MGFINDLKAQALKAIDRRLETRVDQALETRLSQIPQRKGVAWEQFLNRGLESFKKDEGSAQPYKSNPWVYACLSRIATAIAQVPFELFTGDRPVESGPVYDLFRNVNPYMSRYQLWEATAIFLGLYSQCIWHLTWGAKRIPGRQTPPREIWVYPPTRWEQKIDRETGQIIGWEYHAGSKGKIPITPEEVIQFKYFSPYSDYLGQASVQAALQTINTEFAAKKYELAMYRNSCMAGGFLSTPDDLPEEEAKALLALFEGRHQGEDKAHRLGILTGGLQYQDATKSLRDMLAADLHKLNAVETCIVFGMSPLALGVSPEGKSLGGGGEVREARKLAWQDNYLPKLRYFEDVLRTNFFDRYKLKGMEGRFNTESITELQESNQEKWTRAYLALDHGMSWQMANEAFDLNLPEPEKLDPVGYMPMNLVPVGGGYVQEETATPPKQIAAEGVQPLKRMAALIQALPNSPPSPRGPCKVARDHWRRQRESFQRKIRPIQKAFEDKMHTWAWEFRKTLLSNFYQAAPEIWAKAHSKQDFDPSVAATIEGMLPNLEAEMAKMRGLAYPYLEEALGVGGESIYDQLSAMGANPGVWSPDYDAAIKYLTDKSVTLAKPLEGIWTDIKGTLLDGYKEGKSVADVADAIKGDCQGLESRAKLIAHEETVGTAENGKFQAMEQAGIKKKQWLHGGGSVKDPRPHHMAADGETADIEELFSTGLMHPHDWSNGSEEDNLNCHCDVVMPEVDENGKPFNLDDLI